MSDKIQLANRYDMDKCEMASELFAKGLVSCLEMIQDMDGKIQGSEVMAGYIFAGMKLFDIMGNNPGDMLEFTYNMNRAASEYFHENHDKMKIVAKESENPMQQFEQMIHELYRKKSEGMEENGD